MPVGARLDRVTSDDVPAGADPDPAAQLLAARAAVVADLVDCDLDSATTVDVVEDAMVARKWWVDHWPAGAAHLTSLVATDVQERLLDDHGLRWPECPLADCAGQPVHSLVIEPELGEDPHWVCERTGVDLGRVGRLAAAPPAAPPSAPTAG
jgi:hypothetical protein